MVKNIMTFVFSGLQLYIKVNKNKGFYQTKILQTIEKHWSREYLKCFDQLAEVIGSEKFFVIPVLLYFVSSIISPPIGLSMLELEMPLIAIGTRP